MGKFSARDFDAIRFFGGDGVLDIRIPESEIVLFIFELFGVFVISSLASL